MTKKDIDWEKELKPKPFRKNSFTPQMMRKVEQQVKADSGRAALLRRRAGVLVLGAALLAGGFAAERSGVLEGLRQIPPESSVGVPPASQPNGTAESHTFPEEAAQTTRIEFPEKKADGGTAGTVSIPLRLLRAELAIGEAQTDSIPELPDMTFALTAKEAEMLQAVLVQRPDTGEGYVLLAPRSWTPERAVIGANGSVSAEFINPDKAGNPEQRNPGDPGERLRYTETFSGGSVASGIGTYFPDRQTWAERQGFPVQTYEGLALRSQYANEDGEAGFARYDWTRQGDGVVASGAVYYSQNPQNDTLRQLEMSLEGTAYGEAADSILRFFEANQGAQRIRPAASATQALPQGKEQEAAEDSIGIEALRERLAEKGLRLTGLQDADVPFYDQPMNGVEAEELIFDRDSRNAERSERLTLFDFGSRDRAAEEAKKFAQEPRSAENGIQADIYPHVFAGGGFVVLYWTSGSHERPFVYDNKINGVLRALDQSEVQP
ncbi:DUF4850 domain-containing protein [Saccharibacillus qingshengii]|uniref:DUF4850 domain-containing protein n=1 Tax=Saccharibacillus qingshengii TaxID=1763540 RepID=UPI001552FB7B|nr:DUF4850 domain-containing protein [Saccharibacillus qingshengii]